jgi:hypothetical protein
MGRTEVLLRNQSRFSPEQRRRIQQTLNRARKLGEKLTTEEVRADHQPPPQYSAEDLPLLLGKDWQSYWKLDSAKK